jgi:hypothetical protein
MIARDESEDVGNISNEAVQDIVHAALLKGMGKVYHKPDLNFRKIKCMPRLKIANNGHTLYHFFSLLALQFYFLLLNVSLSTLHVCTHTHTHTCLHAQSSGQFYVILMIIFSVQILSYVTCLGCLQNLCT